MGAFPEFHHALFRPEVFKWTTEALFGKKPLSNAEHYAGDLVDIVLQMAVNSMQPDLNIPGPGPHESVMDLIRRLLDYQKHKAPEYVVVGLRVVRVMMTPESDFLAQAQTTRCNQHVDFELVTNALRMAAQTGIQQLLAKCDEKVSLAVLGASGTPLPFVSLLDSLPSPDADREEETLALGHIADPKTRVYLRIVAEGLRCLPFIGWRSGLGVFLDRLYLVHRETAIQTTAALSLQRTMLNYTPFRPAVAESLATVISKPELRGAGHTASLHTVLHHERCLLDLWARILRENAGGQEGLGMIPDEYPAFLARIEGGALTCLGHASVQVRLLALALLRSVASLRRARREAHLAQPHKTDGVWSASPSPWRCIADVLDTEANDIVQRGLFHFMLQGAGGFTDNVVLAESASPPIEKVASGYGDMWEYVLAQIVFATLHVDSEGNPIVHPHIALEAQRILTDLLRGTLAGVPSNPKATEEAKAAWKTAHVLLVAMASPPPSKEIQDALVQAATASGGGSFRAPAPAAESAVSELLQRHAAQGMWPTLIPSGGGRGGGGDDRLAGTEWSRDALEVSCLCCHVVGIDALTRSLLSWYDTVALKRKKQLPGAPVRDVWRLLRTLSQGPKFRAAVTADAGLLRLFLGAVETFVRSAAQTPDFGGDPRDALLLTHNVSAVVSASCGALEGWGLNARRRIYAWLRSRFPWPPTGGADGHMLPFPTLKHFKPQAQADIKCVFATASHLLRQGPLLGEDDIRALVDGSGVASTRTKRGAGGSLETSQLGWFLEAELAGQRTLPYLLLFHRPQLADIFIHHVYNARKDVALVFFHAMCDQMLPDGRIPSAPTSGVTAEMAGYHAALARWGQLHRVADLPRRVGEEDDGGDDEDDALRRISAVSASVGSSVALEGSLGEGKAPSKMSEADAMALLLLGLRALVDPTRAVRSRAFELTCFILTVHLAPDVIVEDSKWAEFARFADRYNFVFDADCTSTIWESALEFTRYVAELCSIYSTANHTQAFFEEVFRPYVADVKQLSMGNFPRSPSRAEWGGLRWTAQIVEEFCRFAALGPGEAGDKVAGCEPDFLQRLYTLTCTFPSGLMDRACAMWLSLAESFLQAQVGNLRVILDFLLATAGGAKDEAVSVCKEVALVLYGHDPDNVADALAAPLHFGNQGDRLRVRSAVILLAQLSRSNVAPLVPHLAAAVNFALVSFPCDASAAKRKAVAGGPGAVAAAAGGGVGGTASLSSLDDAVRLLLHNLLASLRPHLIQTEGSVASPVARTADRLLAYLRAPTFKVNWPLVNVPLERSTGGAGARRGAPPAVPQSPLNTGVSLGASGTARPGTTGAAGAAGAAGRDATRLAGLAAVGGVDLDPHLFLANDPTAVFIRDVTSVFAVAAPTIAEELGLEALLWALHSRDRETCIRGQHVFRTVLEPAGDEAIGEILWGLGHIMIELEKERDAASLGDAVRASPAQVASTGSFFTAKTAVRVSSKYFTNTTRAAELVATLLALTAQCARQGGHGIGSTRSQEEASKASKASNHPALFWAGAALLLCSGFERHLYHLGMRLIALYTRLPSSLITTDEPPMGIPVVTPPPFAFAGVLPMLPMAVLDEDPKEAAVGRALVLHLIQGPTTACDPSDARLARAVLFLLPWLIQEKRVMPPSVAAAAAALVLARTLPGGSGLAVALEGYPRHSETSFLMASTQGFNKIFLPAHGHMVSGFLEMATRRAGVKNACTAFDIASGILLQHDSVGGTTDEMELFVQEFAGVVDDAICVAFDKTPAGRLRQLGRADREARRRVRASAVDLLENASRANLATGGSGLDLTRLMAKPGARAHTRSTTERVGAAVARGPSVGTAGGRGGSAGDTDKTMVPSAVLLEIAQMLNKEVVTVRTSSVASRVPSTAGAAEAVASAKSPAVAFAAGRRVALARMVSEEKRAGPSPPTDGDDETKGSDGLGSGDVQLPAAGPSMVDSPPPPPRAVRAAQAPAAGVPAPAAPAASAVAAPSAEDVAAPPAAQDASAGGSKDGGGGGGGGAEAAPLPETPALRRTATDPRIFGIMLYKFKAQPDSDEQIDVDEGQTIEIMERHDDGWVTVRAAEGGKEGIVPTQYVQEHSVHEHHPVPEKEKATPAAAEPVPQAPDAAGVGAAPPTAAAAKGHAESTDSDSTSSMLPPPALDLSECKTPGAPAGPPPDFDSPSIPPPPGPPSSKSEDGKTAEALTPLSADHIPPPPPMTSLPPPPPETAGAVPPPSMPPPPPSVTGIDMPPLPMTRHRRLSAGARHEVAERFVCALRRHAVT